MSPFFSPDGAWVGFIADRRLKRVPVDGGAAVALPVRLGRPAGASWGVNNRLRLRRIPGALQVVDAGGGTPETVLPVGPGLGHGFPELLPDDRTVLFTEGSATHAVDLVSKRRTDRTASSKVSAPATH